MRPIDSPKIRVPRWVTQHLTLDGPGFVAMLEWTVEGGVSSKNALVASSIFCSFENNNPFRNVSCQICYCIIAWKEKKFQ